VLLATTLGAIASCSGHASSIHLPGFDDVAQAPPAIQTAARAVVRIGTRGELATGSFISPTGLLLTNNHVLGVDICPVEGCFADLTFMYQRSSPPSAPETVFVVPVNVDIGLDMAVVQVYDPTGTTPRQTPDYLTIEPRDPASLLGTHVNVVGHPEGHLKKWSQGQIVDTSGQWIIFSAYALPGNSGSPVLDDDGRIVGILHRGPTSQDLFAGNGVDTYSIGTASAALANAMGAPLPPAMWSIQMAATDDDVVAHENVYLNAHAATAPVAGANKQVVDSLAAACDAGLAGMAYGSPEALAGALAPCFEAEGWIDCAATSAGTFAVCPADAAAWQQRYQSAFDRIQALNGQLQLDLVSFAPEALNMSSSAGFTAAKQSLQAAVVAANPPLDFAIANYLLAFGLLTYQGTDLVGFVRGYAKYPEYGLYGIEIASAASLLYSDGAMSRSDALSILQALASDPNVDEAAKLDVEDIRYQARAIN
jgi:hypothetical protein